MVVELDLENNLSLIKYYPICHLTVLVAAALGITTTAQS